MRIAFKAIYLEPNDSSTGINGEFSDKGFVKTTKVTS